jgi:hypothetical protein
MLFWMWEISFSFREEKYSTNDACLVTCMEYKAAYSLLSDDSLDHAKVCLFKCKVLNYIVFILLGLSAISGHSEDSQDHITWLRFDGHGISTLCKCLLFVDAT